jgi:hypothetical protein
VSDIVARDAMSDEFKRRVSNVSDGEHELKDMICDHCQSRQRASNKDLRVKNVVLYSVRCRKTVYLRYAMDPYIQNLLNYNKSIKHESIIKYKKNTYFQYGIHIPQIGLASVDRRQCDCGSTQVGRVNSDNPVDRNRPF